MSVEFVGLDIETTGSDDKANLIQIGVAKFKPTAPGAPESYSARDLEVFVRDVYVDQSALNLTAEAMKVNGFSVSRILEGQPIHFVDAHLTAWLAGRVNGRAFPVGWNVGTFDMKFVRPAFPHAMRFLQSYRAVDLNSIVLLDGNEWEKRKKDAKRYAQSELSSLWSDETGPTWHDAGYDAAAALLAFQYLQTTFAMRMEYVKKDIYYGPTETAKLVGFGGVMAK